MNPVAFAHPSFRNLRHSDPAAQVASCTARRDALLADPEVDRVTTQLPKRGGPAVMVAWQSVGSERVALGSCIVLPDGAIRTRP